MNKESRKLMMNGQGNLDYNSKPTETKIPKAATIIPDAFSTPRNSSAVVRRCNRAPMKTP